MGAMGPSTIHLRGVVGMEKCVVHGKSIDGMATMGMTLTLIVGEGLTGANNGDSARNVPRWPVDGGTHRFAACVKHIGNLVTIAKRRTQRATRQGCLDLSSVFSN